MGMGGVMINFQAPKYLCCGVANYWVYDFSIPTMCFQTTKVDVIWLETDVIEYV